MKLASHIYYLFDTLPRYVLALTNLECGATTIGADHYVDKEVHRLSLKKLKLEKVSLFDTYGYLFNTKGKRYVIAVFLRVQKTSYPGIALQT